MPRHSFIQITKLTNVCGRIGYISSAEKQEFLYETYDTAAEDEGFWEELADESQEDYWTYASGGSCIEARELIISLPENYTDYTPESVLKLFCESFKEKYGVECIAAIHHNKTRVNYHMHLIFSERKKLEQPIEKIATRNMFYDEEGYHVRTKKEILDENGNVRKGCTIVKKGEVYERHIFDKKNPYFKSRAFLKEIKDFYTELINENVKDPEKKLKVFDKNDVYVAQKKLGKGNPKEELIKANNEDAKEWNRLADYAMKLGVKKEKVIAVKEIEIKEAAKKSIKENGWKPGIFKKILSKAKDVLKVLINEKLRAIEALKAKSKTNKVVDKPKGKPSLKEKLAAAKVEADEINASRPVRERTRGRTGPEL